MLISSWTLRINNRHDNLDSSVPIHQISDSRREYVKQRTCYSYQQWNTWIVSRIVSQSIKKNEG